MHNVSMFFYYFFQKSLFTENYFLIAAINLATQFPLYTCLVLNYLNSHYLILAHMHMLKNEVGSSKYFKTLVYVFEAKESY